MMKVVINKLRKKPLKNILVKWLCGRIIESEVLDRAGAIEAYYYSRKNKIDYSRNQLESILEAVLYKLDGIHYQLITKEDVPKMLEFLQAESKDYEKAWKSWEKYWGCIDYEKRKSELRNNTFYITS